MTTAIECGFNKDQCDGDCVDPCKRITDVRTNRMATGMLFIGVDEDWVGWGWRMSATAKRVTYIVPWPTGITMRGNVRDLGYMNQSKSASLISNVQCNVIIEIWYKYNVQDLKYEIAMCCSRPWWMRARYRDQYDTHCQATRRWQCMHLHAPQSWGERQRGRHMMQSTFLNLAGVKRYP